MSPTLVHLASKSLSFMADSALRSLILAVFLAALLGAFRVRDVRAKLFAWRALLLVALAMPLLLLFSPAMMIPIPAPDLGSASHPTVISLRSTGAAFSSESVQFAPPSGATNFGQAVSTTTPLPRAGSGRVASAVQDSPIWSLFAVSMYLAVGLLLLARILIGAYFARRLVLLSQPIVDADALNCLGSTARCLGLRRAPRLLESGMLRVPVTFGVFHPAILFPAGWRQWRVGELTAVLLHEISHVARRDAPVQWLSLFHRAVFWFNPLAWWLDRHLANLAEQASDEAALAGGADQTGYADALLGFLSDLEAAPARVRWHGLAMAQIGESEKRIERILTWRSAMANHIGKSVAIALVAVCVPAAAIAVSAHPQIYNLKQPPPPPPAFSAPPPPVQLAPDSATARSPVAAPPSPALPADPVLGGPPQIAPSPAPAPPTTPVSASAVPAAPQAQSPVPPEPPAPPPVPVPSPNEGYDWAGDPYWAWGSPFVIATKGSDHPIVFGSEEDAEHARALRAKIPGDFIWFEHDGKSYVIRDQSIVNRAKQIWAQRRNSAKRRQELQAKEQELYKEMNSQMQQRMQNVRVKIPDMSAELQKLQSEIKSLDAKGATMQELGDLQRQLREMQQALSEARLNSSMQEINQRAAELGQQMGEIGRQIGDLARQSVAQARQSSEQMRQLFNNALDSGKAKPE